MTDAKLVRLTEHLYWMPPGPPDRPSLCAVVGERYTLMLEAGASAAHARLFLDAVKQTNVPAPRYVALTHWHWDHVFGAAEVAAPVIAHRLTGQQLGVLKAYDWSDAALDERVSTGEEIAFCADNIKLELPTPRQVEIALPDIVFHDSLELQLGGVTCTMQHVGGDHAADSCVMYIAPDGVLFLSDCLYDAIYAPKRHYTVERLFPLLDRLLAFDAQLYVEGHSDSLLARAQFELLASQLRLAGTLVHDLRSEASVLAAVEAQTGQPADEDMREFISAFLAGYDIG
jgi:glyoxylase-like metal-dependent hydrolase (beta-lactamase superfamily II)